MENKLRDISIEQLRLFLKLSKWESVETNYDGIEAYVSPENEQVYTLLPKDEVDGSVLQDYISKAIRLISNAYDQSVEETVSYLTELDSDHHSFRLKTERNKISLALLEGLINSTKETLYKNSVLEYRTWYDRLSSTAQNKTDAPTIAAKKLINNLQFPHTWKGSFGISIDVPLKYESYDIFSDEFDRSENFGRRATINTAEGLKYFAESVEKKTENYAIEKIGDKKIINSFKPFLEIIETIKKQNLEYSLNLSPIMKGGKFKIFNNLKTNINQSTLSYIYKAIDQVGEEEEPLDISFLGFPTNMKSDRESLLDASRQGTRRVKVTGESPEVGKRTLTFELGFENYKKALHAHENALSVLIECTVQKEGRTYEVLKVDALRIIDKLPS